MTDRAQIIELAHGLADAISRRDVAAITHMLAPGFVLRTPGAAPASADDFLAGIRALPAGIVFVRLEHLEIDVQDSGAFATGIQHARVEVDGSLVDDRKPFADWFVKHAGAWKLRVALNLSAP
jgi:ketosteroid isomerase-like protein